MESWTGAGGIVAGNCRLPWEPPLVTVVPLYPVTMGRVKTPGVLHCIRTSCWKVSGFNGDLSTFFLYCFSFFRVATAHCFVQKEFFSLPMHPVIPMSK